MYRCPKCTSIFNSKHYFRLRERRWRSSADSPTGQSGYYMVQLDPEVTCEYCNNKFNPRTNYKKPDTPLIDVLSLNLVHGKKNTWNSTELRYVLKELEFIKALNHEDRMRYLHEFIEDGWRSNTTVEIQPNVFATINKKYYLYARYKDIFPLQCHITYDESCGWILTPYKEELDSWRDDLAARAEEFLKGTPECEDDYDEEQPEECMEDVLGDICL